MSAFIIILVMLIIAFIVLGIPTILSVAWIIGGIQRDVEKHNNADQLHASRLAKDNANIALANQRRHKVAADLDVLESRRAKLDSEVAILELRIDKERARQGLDRDFTPINYD